jgi:hypothetical protein
VQRWATSLRFFRFCRAFGGHANDGDSLQVLLQFQSEDELLGICTHLGLRLNALPPGAPRPVPNRRYSLAEFSTFRSHVPNLPHWEQPGRCRIKGIPAFVWVEERGLRVSLAGETGHDYASEVISERMAEIWVAACAEPASVMSLDV